MAKYTYINGSLGALFNALSDANENGDYFDSIERVSPQYDWQGFNCIINGNTVFHIEKYSNVTTTIKVYGITPSFTSGTAGDYQYAYYVNAVYECSGGISIVCSRGRIVITKNQRGETMIVFNSVYNGASLAENMVTIGAIAYTDSSTYADYKVNTNTSSQTLLIPICSCAAFDTESYTTTVLLSAYKQFTTVGFLTYNNKRYFFDGYFATEDTETSGGAS